MHPVTQVFAVVAGVLHVLIFAMESLLFHTPRVRASFRVKSESADAVRPWALNQGFYNLFLAAGALGGVILSNVDGHQPAGRAVALFACGCMLAAAVVLLATDRRMLRGAVIQGGAPLIALLGALVF